MFDIPAVDDVLSPRPGLAVSFVHYNTINSVFFLCSLGICIFMVGTVLFFFWRFFRVFLYGCESLSPDFCGSDTTGRRVAVPRRREPLLWSLVSQVVGPSERTVFLCLTIGRLSWTCSVGLLEVVVFLDRRSLPHCYGSYFGTTSWCFRRYPGPGDVRGSPIDK